MRVINRNALAAIVLQFDSTLHIDMTALQHLFASRKALNPWV